MDQIPYFLDCPRCGDRGYENLESYSHCVACLYSPVFEEEPAVPEWAVKYAKESARTFSQAQRRKEERFATDQPKPLPALALQAFKITTQTTEVFNIL